MTKRNGVFIERICHFNSHPHEEDDLYSFCVRICSLGYFNSHPHEEDDWLQKWEERRKENFNSHPHEEDDADDIQARAKMHFNSHPHEEDDFLSDFLPVLLHYFNSHPHEEDDEISFKLLKVIYIFQLTSSRRG